MANQNYISIPILDELVKFAENDSVYEDAVKAMGSGILNYYFQAINGFSVAPEQNRDDNYPTSSSSESSIVGQEIEALWIILLQKRRRQLSLGASLEQLTNALEYANTEHGRCWALLFHGSGIRFYEYHHNLPEDQRLVQWAEAGDPARTVYHVRNNAGAIDRMLRHMAQTAVPPVRH